MDNFQAKILAIEGAKRLSQEHMILEHHISDLRNRLEMVEQKQDQDILKDMRASYAAIQDALSSSNTDTRRIRLELAEETLLKVTGLEPSLETGGIKNSIHIARAHHALYIIAFLRSDALIAARHVQRAFEANARIARTDLFHDLYELQLAPRLLKEIDKWYETALGDLDKKDYKSLVNGNRLDVAKALGSAGAGVGIAIFTRKWRPGNFWALKSLAEELDNGGFSRKFATMSTMRRWDEEALEHEREDRIDRACSQLVREMLSDPEVLTTNDADMDLELQKLPSDPGQPSDESAS